MATNAQRKQQAIFLAVVLVLLLLGIGSGLYFGGVRVGGLGENPGAGGSANNRYATQTDAQMLCEAQARKVFGERIRTLVVDTHSSRLDKKAGLFRVFLEAELYNDKKRQGETVRHFISCFTRTDRLAIASFQFAKDGEAPR